VMNQRNWLAGLLLDKVSDKESPKEYQRD
jgi:hypothetical protein